MGKKWVYLFTEGNADMRELLGGKGAMRAGGAADDRAVEVRAVDGHVRVAQTAERVVVRVAVFVSRAAADDGVLGLRLIQQAVARA